VFIDEYTADDRKVSHRLLGSVTLTRLLLIDDADDEHPW
jgi:hypothetical protein